MDITTKYKIVEKIINSNDEHLLNEIKYLIGLTDRDFWETLPETTKNSIYQGMEDSKNGLTRPHNEVMDEIKRKFHKE